LFFLYHYCYYLIYLPHHADWHGVLLHRRRMKRHRRLRYFYNRQVVYLRLQKDALKPFFTFTMYVYLYFLMGGTKEVCVL
jgi:hypothetical protein